MEILSLILQLATIGLVVYVLLQLKSLFREVRVPAVRQKGQLPADFRERLRTMPRPNAEAPKERSESHSEPRSDRPEGRDRDRNRDGRDRDGRNRDGRNRDGRDRDRNREGRGEPRAERSDRPEGRGDRPERTDRPERSDRPEGRDRDRNRDGRDRDRNRDDRGPRPQRFESAPSAEATSAPVADSAPVYQAETSAPVAASAPAPSFGGRRPLGPARSSAESAPVEESVSGALAPSSLAQPVAEAPIRHGRRSLPKAKPRFDDEPETVTESAV